MGDPWSEWENDDWSAPARVPQKPSDAERWQKANKMSAKPSIPLSAVEAPVAFKPQLQILRRAAPSQEQAAQEASQKAAEALKRTQSAAEEAKTREQRYKEARERLFGSNQASSSVQSPRGSRPQSPHQPVGQPRRQAHGPRGQGFQDRTRPADP